MDEIRLTRHELSFAFLVESHSKACECLFDFVVNAVKDTHPDDWRKTLCVGLGESLTRHINLSLETNSPHTDIYSVCRLLRYRIDDVARYCGGKLSDAHQKERLCLQVYGVETARHWVFHGDQKISPIEVRSSIILLSTILRTLSCKREEIISVAGKLTELAENTRQLASGKPEVGRYVLMSDTIISTLLYRSLVELKRNFEEKFNNRQTGTSQEEQPAAKQALTTIVQDDYSSLFKKIRKAVNEEPKRIRKDFSKADYIRMCGNVREARNMLVHNPPVKADTAKKVLAETCSLLEYFHLDHTESASAMEVIVHLPAKKRECYICVSSVETNSFCRTLEERERILRPGIIPLVGRQAEILEIQSALTTGEELSSSQKILICGPAGIGKSYLATHVAKSLSLVYNKQSWLNCSTPYELERELKFLFLNSKNSPDLSKAGQCLSFPFDKTTVDMSRLYILDDVCSSTMIFLPDLLGKNSPALITTRSPAVKHFLETNLELLHVVELEPFSSAESWDLIKEVVSVSDMSTRELASIDKVLNEVLENMPLCVSSYSSWLSATKRKKEKKKKGESKSANISNEVEELGSDTTTRNWSKLEECFGNRLHVRGLKGVVQSAESHLENHPLDVLLLAKICVLDSQIIPWHLMKKSYRWTAYNVEARLQRLVNGVLGVMDWLFSDREQHTLVSCRDALEEIGLIRWKVSTSTVHVHGLTLQILQQMLEERCLFLDHIMSVCTQQSRNCAEANIKMEVVCKCISEELLLQVVSRGIVDLRQAWKDELNEEEIEKARMCTFPFLSHIVLKARLDNLSRKSVADGRLKRVEWLLVESLALAGLKLQLLVSASEIKVWARIYKKYPGNEDMRVSLDFCECETEAWELVSEERMEEAFSLYDQRLLPYREKLYGCNSYNAAYCHCQIAALVQERSGTTARQGYLAEAAQKCPRLLTEPTPAHVWREITELLRKGHDPSYGYNTSASECVDTWAYLAMFKVTDNLTDGHCTDMPMTLTALLLIVLFQQRQRLLEEWLTARQGKLDRDSKTLPCLVQVVRETKREVHLWFRLGQFGRAVRAFQKAQAKWPHLKHLLNTSTKASDVRLNITSTVKNIFERTLFCYFQLGHFSLPSRLLSEISNGRHFVGPRGRSRPSRGDENFPPNSNECLLADSAILGQLLPTDWTQELAEVYDKLCACYEHNVAPGALQLDDLSSLYSNDLFRSDTPISIPHLCEELKLEMKLSQHLLAGESSKGFRQVGRSLEVLCQKDTFLTSESWRVKLQKRAQLMKSIGLTEELPLMDKIFPVGEIETEFKEGNIAKARKRALKCWRKMDELGLVEEVKQGIRSSNCRPIGLEEILVIVLAKLLRRIYSHQERYSAAEWFAKFCFRFSKELRLGFLAGKCGLECAEFLEMTGCHLEALEQCRLVHRSLEEDFGDDYLQWLPDAPKALHMLHRLENENSRKTM